ncbi:MAG TPA: hypothetical protein VFJ82_23045 [Longimicrobium sp.]|nr:hypothetical protein [Longimicrobium sp.]
MAKLQCALAIAGALACARAKPDPVDAASATQAAVAPRAPAAVSAAPAGAGVVREETVVRMGATPERWALVWRRPPRPACGPEEPEMALTCPCTGFAYGEAGELDLVRRRPGQAEERLALTPLFREAGGDGPGDIDSLAVLQRWPVREPDVEAMDGEGLPRAIRARRAVRVMALGDYDHDGRATEFLLQVGTLPCGKRQAVLVGVSRANSSMHVFRSQGHPGQPLVLPTYVWERLRRSGGRATIVEWPCGDHGAETETDVSLWAGPAGIDGTRAEYECTAGTSRGRLLSTSRM